MEIHLPIKDIEQFYSRMVFNCVAVNQDDHVKKYIILNESKWRMEAVTRYDVTYSYDVTNKWLSAHQMTIKTKRQFNIDIPQTSLCYQFV